MRLKMNFGIISLGCSKNLVDTEIIMGKIKDRNYKIVQNPEKADIILINTCGFIEQAKQEAIDTILEMAQYKQKRCKKLIVTGCLVQRYYKDLKKLLPEVDIWIPINDYDAIDKIINNIQQKSKYKKMSKISEIKKLPMFTQNEYEKREISTGRDFAYLKIAEGCSNNCTYCAIPYIRGKFQSRKIEDILKEAELLAQKGIKELIVIAQDTTKYGIDIYGEPKLAELLEKLAKIENIHWVRFLYSYPEGIDEKLIKVVKENNKICSYFDIPIQHISNSVLKRMNRKTNKEQINKIITKIRKQIPDAILRTSLIVGFPGETKQDFEELQQFVKQTKWDRLGVFMYSKEENTPAEKLPNHIHGNTKKARYKKIMEEQQKIVAKKLKEKIGTIEEVLLENITQDGKYYIARSSKEVPEIDGIYYIKKEINNNDKLHTFVNVKITGYNGYDFIAKLEEGM